MKRTVLDTLGRTVTYSYPPKRIISLCPGITDTLLALGLKDEIAGRTRFCIHPLPEVLDIPAVAGTKDMKLDQILQLQPDLVIAEKEENTKEMVDTLASHVPVYVAEVQTVGEAYGMMTALGDVTARGSEAAALVRQIETGFRAIEGISSGSVLYMIWKKPYMAAGNKTYIDSVLAHLGFTNASAPFDGRYPALEPIDIQNADSSLVLLASEPYPFKEKHIDEFQELLPTAQIVPVDGEMFWYGPRMLEAVPYFEKTFSRLSQELSQRRE
ncbi:iron ABC transporter [Sporosarcina sp. NCCP-2716]|uniref:ABC transporter substrate-binding protein n=1 Tax=Sporosarcina sp. NCCP-2716 TaxID=2943679 RepID=UPI0020401EA7|nr:helical backbone metal receptor [Sporosarcina sp. NCCP-2716]GKV69887.1 iron ABC transporter [Sporosarcina sp. NCCP-2716]